MAQLIRDVMTDNPIVLTGETNLVEAARAMRDNDIGAVIVSDETGALCGIVTDRDLVVRGLAEGEDPEFATLDEVCSRELVTLAADEEAERAVAIMRERGVRRIVVQDGGDPVGIVSLGDLARDRDSKSVLGQISSKPATR